MPRHLPLNPHTNHPFNLQYCLKGRQDFRWRNLPDAYHSVILNNTLIHIRQTEDRLHYQSTPDADLSCLLTTYFRLDDDLDAIHTIISARDDHVAKLVKKYPGVRLMRQPDPWECLVSYICSARAAPPRITHRVETIATQLGRPLTLDGETRHTFPDPATVLTAGPRPTAQIALGFQRVPHAIIQAAKLIRDGTSTYTASPNPTSPTTKSSPSSPTSTASAPRSPTASPSSPSTRPTPSPSTPASEKPSKDSTRPKPTPPTPT